MTIAPRPDEIDRFRGLITRHLGLLLDDAKLGLLSEVLSRRLEVVGHSADAYLDHLDGPDVRAELGVLASELTINETYFMRNIDQFRALADVVLPERIAARRSARKLGLLSAGCASGDEAYSLALVLRTRLTEPGWETTIRGVDVDPAVLAKAARARFTTWSMRETPADLQRRWFRTEGRELVLDESIRAAVTFQERNLVVEDHELWAPESYDVIFCRNVLMYFTTEVAAAVVARMARALVPGGYLFLGHAETLRGLSSDFHLRHTHETFYYQRKDGSAVAAAGTFAATAPAVVDLDSSTSWVDAIQRASTRIEALSDSPEHAARPVVAPSALNVALELLGRERFADALAQLAALQDEAGRDPEVLLLRAVLLTHSGKLDDAAKAAEEILVHDELNTGAHYLLALCREGAGDRQGAVDHDQVASYLDPAFAMPRLHLGLIARRSGDREGARRELTRALLLLQREDPARLLLYGGGFAREALLALCRAELVAAGGRP